MGASTDEILWGHKYATAQEKYFYCGSRRRRSISALITFRPLMERQLLLAEETASAHGDERSKPRVCLPLLATVRGLDEQGESFSVMTAVDNLSANSLYLRLLPCVKPGTLLTIHLKLSTSTRTPKSFSQLSINGIVRRVEQKPGGVYGVAITFTKTHSF